MNDNGIPQGGKTLFTFEEEEYAREWVEKALARGASPDAG